ncbi:MAG: FtsW/RodA/SpoVE family cell cycle protein [Planctomycetota bacterium]
MKLVRAAVGRVALRRMPWHLLLCALALAGIGAAFIYSSHSRWYAQKHLIFAAVGCVAFLALSLFDYRHLTSVAIPLYAAGLLSLAGLFLLGTEINYARRWYDLRLFAVQPSEPMKYILAIALADYFRFRDRLDRLRDLLPPLVLTGLPMMLIVLQPDLGTAMLLLPLFFGVAFLAGVPVRNLAILVAVGVASLLVAWVTPGLLQDYQRDRVMSFIDPAGYGETDAAYNAEQVVMAVSGGGLTGQGWGQGVLTRLHRIPEQYADFIFAVVAEEWGFARTAPLVGLFLVTMGLLAYVARTTREPFGRLLVGGVLILLAVQSILHMAISLRLAPITGLTLPLVSYGGSSLVTTFAGLGLVASVRTHRSVVFAEDEPGR